MAGFTTSNDFGGRLGNPAFRFVVEKTAQSETAHRNPSAKPQELHLGHAAIRTDNVRVYPALILNAFSRATRPRH
jgi:hypothetical protein